MNAAVQTRDCHPGKPASLIAGRRRLPVNCRNADLSGSDASVCSACHAYKLSVGSLFVALQLGNQSIEGSPSLGEQSLSRFPQLVKDWILCHIWRPLRVPRPDPHLALDEFPLPQELWARYCEWKGFDKKIGDRKMGRNAASSRRRINLPGRLVVFLPFFCRQNHKHLRPKPQGGACLLRHAPGGIEWRWRNLRSNCSSGMP
jgi:hypothetical protein